MRRRRNIGFANTISSGSGFVVDILWPFLGKGDELRAITNRIKQQRVAFHSIVRRALSRGNSSLFPGIL